MYKFNKFTFGWLNVYVATPSVGDLWKKQFESGVTPQNQFSLNVYTSGEFHISGTGFAQTLGVGDSNLQIEVAEFPTDSLVVETPISGPACRMCLSVQGGGKWARTRLDVAAGETFDVGSDEYALIVPKTGWDGQGNPNIQSGRTVTASAECYVFLMTQSVIGAEAQSVT